MYFNSLKKEIILAHHKSCLKRIKTNEKARVRNLAAKNAVRTTLEKVLQAGKDEAATVSKDLLALVDRTARKGIMHKNKASRIKSRIQKRLAPAKA